MRIAVLSYHTCPLATLGGKDTGGMNVYVRELVKELGRQGIGADVFTRSQDEHVPHVLHHLGYGNRIVHIPAGPETPVDKKELHSFLPEYVGGIEAFSNKKSIQYDLIHSHYWLSGLAALDLQGTWKVPTIQMFHTLAEMKYRVARSEEEVPTSHRLESERMLLQSVDRVIASTQAEVAQIQWLYQTDVDRVVVIPPGVDTSHFYPIPKDEAKEFIGIPSERQIILYVGRIEPLKGIDALLEAMALLKSKGIIQKHNLCLMVIGGEVEGSPDQYSTELSRLRELEADLGIGDLVTFLGKQDQDTLQYYYSSAEALVMPSHYESFGMVALEAMACGTPVVASETGGLVFLVRDGETGFHVPTARPDALADRLETVVKDPQLRASLGSQAATHAQEYAWPKVTEKIISLYQELMADDKQ
jgi:D-inositol-3-phosphate glycosyltransferase